MGGWVPALLRTGHQHSAKVVRSLTLLGLGVALGIGVVGGKILLDGRSDAWRRAEQASANLAVTLERDLDRTLGALDLSIQGAITALTHPRIDQADPEIRHMALFDRASLAEHVGSVIVLDRNGTVMASSTSLTPRNVNLADRDYFRAHRDSPDHGLFISHPFLSRLRGGDPTIALSRRLFGAQGQFDGVVVGTLRLSHVQELFGKLDLGPQGAVTLLRLDGTVMARHPFLPAHIGTSIGTADAFRRFLLAPSGQLVGVSVLDDVERFYTYRRVGDLPLIVSVNRSVDEIYADWQHKALGVGLILILLGVAIIALSLMFRREMLRRIGAEAALTDAAENFKRLATTDSLTGLANRREFDATLDREWRRAIRDQTPISLLMLDADHFKAYNDMYGHHSGDDALRAIASSIQAAIRRPADIGARYGGEEFAVLLPDTDTAGATTIAEHIRAGVEDLAILHEESTAKRVTVSVGVATRFPRRGQSADLLAPLADKALYMAKDAGRNRVYSQIAAVLPPRSEDSRPDISHGMA